MSDLLAVQEAISRLTEVQCPALGGMEKDALDTVLNFLRDPRGWPEITVGGDSPAHSPVDRYRCENDDCPRVGEVWEFRPDDYELDESVVICRSCGEEGTLFFRWFRGGNR